MGRQNESGRRRQEVAHFVEQQPLARSKINKAHVRMVKSVELTHGHLFIDISLGIDTCVSLILSVTICRGVESLLPLLLTLP